MEAIQLLMSVRGAAAKVKQAGIVNLISHGLQSLGIKIPDSTGQFPAMKTPQSAVAAQAFIELLVHVYNEARKGKQFSLAEKVRSGLESLDYQMVDTPGQSSVARRVKS